MDETETEQRHESYGMIQINRRTSNRGTFLFGSPVADHFQTFSLKIAHGCAIENDLGELSYRAVGGIVEVELSAAQFVEMVTTQGVNDGIPCTITRLAGKILEDPPRPNTDVERSHAAFEARMGDFGRRLDRAAATVDRVTEGLPKARREEIRQAVNGIVTEVRSNIPFFLRTFTEAAERIVTSKKAEVDAWLATVLRNAGLAHLRGLGAGSHADIHPPALTLTEGSGSDA